MSDPAFNAAERIRQADDAAFRAQLAWETGRFQSYWEQQGREAEARVEAMYGDFFGDSDADAAGGGASGGHDAGGDVHAKDDADRQPSEAGEGPPPAA